MNVHALECPEDLRVLLLEGPELMGEMLDGTVGRGTRRIGVRTCATCTGNVVGKRGVLEGGLGLVCEGGEERGHDGCG